MVGLQFGLRVASADARETIELVKLAEKNGFGYTWHSDSQLLMSDPYVVLAACAVKTSKIRLGTSVSNIVTRHPTVLANAISTVDDISGGRAALGVGRGDTSLRLIGLEPPNLEEFGRSVDLVRRLLHGETVDYKGKRVRLARATEVPVYVAATGPRSLRVAGAFADGAIVFVGHNKPLLEYALDNIRRGAEDAGRDYRRIDIVSWTPCGFSEDPDMAREEVRPLVGSILDFGGGLIKAVPFEVSGLDEEFRNRFLQVHDYTKHFVAGAPHVRMITNDLVDRYAVAGTPEECFDKFAEMQRTGVNQCLLVSNGDRRKLVETVGRNLPSLSG